MWDNGGILASIAHGKAILCKTVLLWVVGLSPVYSLLPMREQKVHFVAQRLLLKSILMNTNQEIRTLIMYGNTQRNQWIRVLLMNDKIRHVRLQAEAMASRQPINLIRLG